MSTLSKKSNHTSTNEHNFLVIRRFSPTLRRKSKRRNMVNKDRTSSQPDYDKTRLQNERHLVAHLRVRTKWALKNSFGSAPTPASKLHYCNQWQQLLKTCSYSRTIPGKNDSGTWRMNRLSIKVGAFENPLLVFTIAALDDHDTQHRYGANSPHTSNRSRTFTFVKSADGWADTDTVGGLQRQPSCQIRSDVMTGKKRWLNEWPADDSFSIN